MKNSVISSLCKEASQPDNNGPVIERGLKLYSSADQYRSRESSRDPRIEKSWDDTS